jgi:hypothetical protein
MMRREGRRARGKEDERDEKGRKTRVLVFLPFSYPQQFRQQLKSRA